jgi:hypothetical protein
MYPYLITNKPPTIEKMIVKNKMVKISNKNNDLKQLTNYGFKKETTFGGGGSNVYKYEYYYNKQINLFIVYNTMSTDEKYYEIHNDKFMDNPIECVDTYYDLIPIIIEKTLSKSMELLINSIPVMLDNDYEEMCIKVNSSIEKLDKVYRKYFPNEFGISPTTASI